MVAIPTRYEDVEILVPSTEIIEISSDDVLTNSWDGESSQQELSEIPMPHVYVPGCGVHPYMPQEPRGDYSEYNYPYTPTEPSEEDMTAAMQANQGSWEGEQGVEPLAQGGIRDNQMPSDEMLDLYGQPFAIPSPVYNPNREENQAVQGGMSAVNFGSFEEAVPYEGRPVAYLGPDANMGDFWDHWDRDAQRGGPISPRMTGEDGTGDGMLPVIANLATFFGIQVGGEPANQEVPTIDLNNEVVEEQVPVENLNQVDHVEVENQVVEENENRVEVEHQTDDDEEDTNHGETVAENEIPTVWEMGSSSGRRPDGRLRFRAQARKRVPIPARASMPCRVCGGYGHFTYACPNERSGRPMSRITCYACGRRGHYATSCPGTPTPSSSSSSSTNARRTAGRRGGHSG